jgi:hypothetical protein
MTPTTSIPQGWDSTNDIEAHLADGTVLHFPGGTDPEVIHGIVQKQYGQVPVSASPGPPRTPPIAAAPIPQQLQGPPDKPGLGSAISNAASLAGSEIKKEATGVKTAVSNMIRPIAAGTAATEMGAAGAEIGTGIGGPIGTAIGGLAGFGLGYTITDQALARAKNLITNTPGENPSTEDSLKDAAFNWAGGKLIGLGQKAVKGIVSAGQQGIADLQGTVSQYLESMGQDSSKNSAVKWLANALKGPAKAVEDLGSPAAKTAAIQRSGGLANQQLENQVTGVTGTTDPNKIADQYQNMADLQRRGSLAESNKQALAARAVAKSNILTIPGNLADAPEVEQIAQSQTGKSFKLLDQQSQQGVLRIAQQAGIQPPPGEVIEGPINGVNSIPQATQIVQDHLNALSKDPAMASVVNIANDIKSEFSNGPVSFGKVWDLKQKLDTLYDSDSIPLRNAARGLAANLNDDMEQSIANWPNDPQKLGYKAWNLAKATVQQRLLTFNPEGSGIENVGNLIDKANGILPKMEQTINDPRQLERALNAGEVAFPSGTLPAPNARQTLQAYKWNSLRENAKSADAVNNGITIDAQKMYDGWNDPKFSSSRDMLYSNQQDSNYSQLLKNIAMTQKKQMGIGPSAKLWMTAKGLALAAPLLTGTLTGHELAGGAFTLMEIGAMGVSKAMTYPRVARGLIAAAAGQPLSMSDQQFSRMLAGAIQGSAVTIVGSDGKRTTGSLDKDGHFTAEDQAAER